MEKIIAAVVLLTTATPVKAEFMWGKEALDLIEKGKIVATDMHWNKNEGGYYIRSQVILNAVSYLCISFDTGTQCEEWGNSASSSGKK